jgi:hypothetical protein
VPEVHQWGRYEGALESAIVHEDPVHDLDVVVSFAGPSGQVKTIPAFWDGGRTWRVRFCPDEPGQWSACVQGDVADPALSAWKASFVCTTYQGGNPLYQHGTVNVASDGHYLAHADGTPFFFLGDTAWNGPMASTPDEWDEYLADRSAKHFSAVLFLATQYRASRGTPDGRRAYEGHDHIRVDPIFFQNIDPRVDAINEAGLLAAPLLLHAGRDTDLNPGNDLGPAEAAALARYMVARYGAHHVMWDFVAEAQFHQDPERWRQLGRAVFKVGDRHPVTLHPHGRDWVLDEFAEEHWMDVLGYQSAHGDDDAHWEWILHGPPSTDWRRAPARPIMNLELPYEGHLGRPGGVLFDDFWVRRASYWSLLTVPPAGVTYGSHGVWSWSDGSAPPMAHAHTGTPKPWREALQLPGSTSLSHMVATLSTTEWWRLLPASELLLDQPGDKDIRETVVAARTPDGEVAVIYTPTPADLQIDLTTLATPLSARWVDPRTGHNVAAGEAHGRSWRGRPPGEGDWLLVLSRER